MKMLRSNETPWVEMMDHGPYQGRRKALGGERIACGLWQLPPGKRSFPFHRHHGTEEALFVLEGRAKVRTPESETAIGAGDFVSFPAGGPAHQLINDGAAPLVYLAMSNSVGVDVVDYPDSGKIACAFGTWPNLKKWIFREKDQTGYWDDEQ
jgi:uncharacterized cupin superfamily protein